MISSTETVTNAVNSATNITKKVAAIAGAIGEFDKLLKANLAPDAGNQVSEEELFAAVTLERIQALKGAEAAQEFSANLAAQKNTLQAPDGFVPHEQATINALKKMVGDKKLTEEEGSQVYSEAFAASQLDENKSALFDSRGGPGDPTMAMASLSVAMKQAREVIEKLVGDSTNLDLKSIASAAANSKGAFFTVNNIANGAVIGDANTPNGTVVDGPEGFLFKPVTNNEGKLAVLLGQNLTGNISHVLIKDSTNKVLEEGRLQTAGIKETGREKWNFSKKGGDYPKDITVEIKLSSGEVQRYKIPDPSKRYD